MGHVDRGDTRLIPASYRSLQLQTFSSWTAPACSTVPDTWSHFLWANMKSPALSTPILTLDRLYSSYNNNTNHLHNYGTPTNNTQTTREAATSCHPPPTPPAEQQQQQQQHIFVSKHHHIDRVQILEYLTRKGFVYKDNGDKVVIQNCPMCHPIKGQITNQWKLAVYSNGGYNCVRCGNHGSWYDFKKSLGDIPNISRSGVESESASASHGTSAFAQSPSHVLSSYSPAAANNAFNTYYDKGKSDAQAYAANQWSSPVSSTAASAAFEHSSSSNSCNSNGSSNSSKRGKGNQTPDIASVIQYPVNLLNNDQVMRLLTGNNKDRGQRGLTKEVLMKYGVGLCEYAFPSEEKLVNGQVKYEKHSCITYPWITLNGAGLTPSMATSAIAQIKAKEKRDKIERKRKEKEEEEAAAAAAAVAAAATAGPPITMGDAVQVTAFKKSVVANAKEDEDNIGDVAPLDVDLLQKARGDARLLRQQQEADDELDLKNTVERSALDDDMDSDEVEDNFMSPASSPSTSSPSTAAATTSAAPAAPAPPASPSATVSVSVCTAPQASPPAAGESAAEAQPPATTIMGLPELEGPSEESLIPYASIYHVLGDMGFSVNRLKLRSIKHKHLQRLLPAGGQWGFFGWHTVPAGCDVICITEGEYDAMSVYQATGVPSISLPNGANSLPVELLPCLEHFKKIYLWMDDDRVGQESAEQFVKKLGVSRCFLVRSKGDDPNGPKDANDALRMGMDLKKMLLEAKQIAHKSIGQFKDMRNDVRDMFLNPVQQAGTPYISMHQLHRLVKGHRIGELTIFTGPTGVGKTTILSQLSLDICMQGVTTLWGSFEIKNPRLAKSMLSQYCGYAGVELAKDINNFDIWADRFTNLPLYFLKFYGSSAVHQVLDAMDYAVYVYDVKHIVLDNLQFMLSGQGKGVEKFDLQDKAIEAFRQFATNRNVHITLVIHPRKEQEGEKLGLASVFGSAKATQEADNVVIVQAGLSKNILRRHNLLGRGAAQRLMGGANAKDEHGGGSGKGHGGQGGKQYPGTIDSGFGEQMDTETTNILETYFRTIEVRKNRFDGDVGAVPVTFNKATQRVHELDDRDFANGLSKLIANYYKERQLEMLHSDNAQENRMREQLEEAKRRVAMNMGTSYVIPEVVPDLSHGVPTFTPTIDVLGEEGPVEDQNIL